MRYTKPKLDSETKALLLRCQHILETGYDMAEGFNMDDLAEIYELLALIKGAIT